MKSYCWLNWEGKVPTPVKPLSSSNALKSKTKKTTSSKRILDDIVDETGIEDGHVWEGQGTIGF